MDGTRLSASFIGPEDIAFTRDGTVAIILDLNPFGPARVRAMSYPGGEVTSFAGHAQDGYHATGSADGTGTAASFNAPHGLAVSGNSAVLVADTNNNCIRSVTYPGGVVTTIAGGQYGYQDGTGTNAYFKNPGRVAVMPNGVAGCTVFIADHQNSRIRMVMTPQ